MRAEPTLPALPQGSPLRVLIVTSSLAGSPPTPAKETKKKKKFLIVKAVHIIEKKIQTSTENCKEDNEKSPNPRGHCPYNFSTSLPTFFSVYKPIQMIEVSHFILRLLPPHVNRLWISFVTPVSLQLICSTAPCPVLGLMSSRLTVLGVRGAGSCRC